MFTQYIKEANLTNNLNLRGYVSSFSEFVNKYDKFSEMKNTFSTVKHSNFTTDLLELIIKYDKSFVEEITSEKYEAYFVSHSFREVFKTYLKEQLDVTTMNTLEINLVEKFMKVLNELTTSRIHSVTEKMKKDDIEFMISLYDLQQEVAENKFLSMDKLQYISSGFMNLKSNNNEVTEFYSLTKYLLNVLRDKVQAEGAMYFEVQNERMDDSEIILKVYNLFKTASNLDDSKYKAIIFGLEAYYKQDIPVISYPELNTFLKWVLALEKEIVTLPEKLYTVDDLDVDNLYDNYDFFKKRRITVKWDTLKYLMKNTNESRDRLMNKLVSETIEHISQYEFSEVRTNLLFQHIYQFNNKKAFLKLLQSLNEEELNALTEHNFSLFNSNANLDIFKYVNVNTLNKETLLKLAAVSSNTNFLTNLIKLLEENEIKQLTAQELLFLVQFDSQSYIVNLFLHFKDLKVDERLKLLKSLPETIVYTLNTQIPFFHKDEILTRIKQMDKQEIIHFYKEYKHLPKNVALAIHLFKADSPILNDVQKEDDFIFLKNNQKLIIELIDRNEAIDKGESDEEKVEITIAAMQEEILSNSYKVQEFKKFLNVKDEEFFVKYRENLMKFMREGLIDKAMKYKQSVGYYTNQLKNFSLILKAELAGKLDVLKENYQDLTDELDSSKISEEMYKKWFENTSLKGRYLIKETNDFKTLFEMGENPVSSCMSYDGGAYNRCLLSIFDSNKKIIAVYDKDKLVGRAILRFTKAKEGVLANNKKSLGFRDIEDENEIVEVKKIKDSKKDLVLFVERLYTHYDSSDRKEMIDGIIELMILKAKDLGVNLIASRDYNGNASTYKPKQDLNVFISHSKNGEQYLDSLGGMQDASAGGVYRKADVLRVNLDSIL